MWYLKTVKKKATSIRRKACLNVTFSTKNPMWIALVSNPGLSDFFAETEVFYLI